MYEYVSAYNTDARLFRESHGNRTTAPGRPAASGTGRLSALWLLSGLVALPFIGAGGAKLAGAAVMVDLFVKVGLGQWFRYVTGLLEVAAGIGLLMSRSAFYSPSCLPLSWLARSPSM